MCRASRGIRATRGVRVTMWKRHDWKMGGGGGGQINGSQNEYTPLYVRLSIGPKVTLSAYEGT